MKLRLHFRDPVKTRQGVTELCIDGIEMLQIANGGLAFTPNVAGDILAGAIQIVHNIPGIVFYRADLKEFKGRYTIDFRTLTLESM